MDTIQTLESGPNGCNAISAASSPPNIMQSNNLGYVTDTAEPVPHDAGADELMSVLGEAFNQCVKGKGNERHGHDSQLFQQQWVSLAKHHSVGFLTGQAAKKLNEAASLRLVEGYTRDAYERELLGAIVYTAFAIIFDRGIS